MPKSLFVSRDFHDPLDGVLHDLRSSAPSGWKLDIPSPGDAEPGNIPTLVNRALERADRVLAFVRTENSHVAFEVGYAAGRRKQILFAGPGPAQWFRGSPLGSEVVLGLSGQPLATVLFSPVLPALLHFATPAWGRGTLFLLPPAGGLANPLHYAAFRRPHWRVLTGSAGTLGELVCQLDGIGRIVWIRVPQERDDGGPDGRTDAGFAFVAGLAAAFRRALEVVRFVPDAGTPPRRILVSDADHVLNGVDRLLGYVEGLRDDFELRVDGEPYLRNLAALADAAPDRAVFEALCREAMLDPGDFSESSPVERWHRLVRLGSRCGLLAASALLSPRAGDLLRELVLPTPSATPAEPVLGDEWRVRKKVMAALASLSPPVLPHLSGRGVGPGAADGLGMSVLLAAWGKEELPPALRALEADPALAGPEVQALWERAQARWWIPERNGWADPHLGPALAAHALVGRAERDPSAAGALLQALLDVLERAGPDFLEALGLFLRWWEPGSAVVRRWEAAVLAKAPPRNASEQNRTLERLVRCDRLLRDALGAGSLPTEEWAVENGLGLFLARVLEGVGERRAARYARYLGCVAEPSGRAALAHAVRRIVDADPDQEEALPGGARGVALRGLLQRATPGELEELAQDPAALRLWLSVAAPPYTDAHLEALVRIHAWHDRTRRGAAGARQAALAWSKLLVEPDLTRVWALLGEHRTAWVERLVGGENGSAGEDGARDARAWLLRRNVSALVRFLEDRPPGGREPGEQAAAGSLVRSWKRVRDGHTS